MSDSSQFSMAHWFLYYIRNKETQKQKAIKMIFEVGVKETVNSLVFRDPSYCVCVSSILYSYRLVKGNTIF